jgi:hypothetical protein
MKSLDLVWSPLKTFSIIEFRVVLHAYLFDLVLELAAPPAALEHVVDFPLRQLIIDYRQRRF